MSYLTWIFLCPFDFIWFQLDGDGDEGFDDDEVMEDGDVEPFDVEELWMDLSACLDECFTSSCCLLFFKYDGFFLLSKYFSSLKREFKY